MLRVLPSPLQTTESATASGTVDMHDSCHEGMILYRIRPSCVCVLYYLFPSISSSPNTLDPRAGVVERYIPEAQATKDTTTQRLGLKEGVTWDSPLLSSGKIRHTVGL